MTVKKRTKNLKENKIKRKQMEGNVIVDTRKAAAVNSFM
jgi:hypothetical protein